MKKLRLVPLLAAAGLLVLAPAASASNVIVGSPLTGTFLNGGPAEVDGTIASITAGRAGASAASPVNGVVVRWHMIKSIGGPFELRILRPAGALAYTGVGSSSAVAVVGMGLETFGASLPVKAGDVIGLDVSKGSTISYAVTPGSSFAEWTPPLSEGDTRAGSEGGSSIEIGFNAEIQPAPAVSGLSPASGSFKGGTAVTISGSDLEGASAVSFGATPAQSFSVAGEGSITAVAPPSQTLTRVPVSITTIAGTVTSASTYTYVGCKVPSLKGKKLKAAKSSLKKSGCKLGAVTKKKGITGKTGKVKKQGPKPGKLVETGTKVKVTLG